MLRAWARAPVSGSVGTAERFSESYGGAESGWGRAGVRYGVSMT